MNLSPARIIPRETRMSDKRKPLKKKQVKEKPSAIPVEVKPLGEAAKKPAPASKKS